MGENRRPTLAYSRQHLAVGNEVVVANGELDGIPKCRHCGGETQFVRFAVVKSKRRGKDGLAEGQGRLWFRCRTGSPACGGEQTILCSSSPCDLLPLWRTEDAYAAMPVSHQSYEHKHRDLRIQYLVAPDCLALRPKRPGMAWQQLRASAALLIEWLRVLQRAGWGKAKATVAPPRQLPRAATWWGGCSTSAPSGETPPLGRRLGQHRRWYWSHQRPELTRPPTEVGSARPPSPH